jgi:hypothetical protein
MAPLNHLDDVTPDARAEQDDIGGPLTVWQWQEIARTNNARLVAAEASLVRLRSAISQEGLTGDALIALAEAHKQYSEIVDETVAGLARLRSEIEQIATEMREKAHRPDDRDAGSIWSWRADEWADRLAALARGGERMIHPCICGHEKSDHQTRLGQRGNYTPCCADGCKCEGFRKRPK